MMDGQGLMFVIDQLGKSLAATAAENDELKTQVAQLTEAMTRRQGHRDGDVYTVPATASHP